ncbi:MAG: glutamine-hydrolyzing carbamoyl-phosphate synthase small subunit [Nitrospirota bacterium]
MKRAILALADGAVFKGYSFGAEGETGGEVVFNTSMTGYQEIITDPSYRGQIVTMTYTMIGNYGINDDDIEAVKPHLSGFIVKEYSRFSSSWRKRGSLDKFLRDNNIAGIEGVDTRALTRHIRDRGEQQGIISTIDSDIDRLIAKANASPSLIGRDMVKEVTCEREYLWEEGAWDFGKGYVYNRDERDYHIVVYDFGVKRNILRMLVSEGFKVTVVPAMLPAKDCLKMNPDGILMSNGPGDPEGIKYAIENTRELLGKKPIFGICLGHQILGLALGLKTYRLKFGHHGGNQPVMDLSTREVEITAQNHGFAIDPDSIEKRKGGMRVEITHINLNDNSVEGLRCTDIPVYSVQYHPEASPGPHDSSYLFKMFREMIVTHHKKIKL